MRAACWLALVALFAGSPALAGEIAGPGVTLTRTFISVTPGADMELGNFERRLDRFTNPSTLETVSVSRIEVMLLNPEDVGFPDLETDNVSSVVAAAASAFPFYSSWGTSFWNYPGGIPALDVPPVTWTSFEFPSNTFPFTVGPGESFVLETVAHNNLFGPVNPPPERIGELIIGWRFLSEECGNGLVEANESCDDGNTNDADGCRNDCTIPVCGDGIVDAFLQEQCDDANGVDGDACRNNCTIPVCGDQIVDPQNSETCDPPGAPAGANDLDCRGDCTVCGDGVTDLTEDCDDGNAVNDDACRSDCTAPVCGDGIVDAFTAEDCDDGNLSDDDGCRNDCTAPVCGDGIVDGIRKEQCDDGNTVDEDACRNNCTLPFCGDLIVDAFNGETCDPPGDPAGANDLDCRGDCTVCGDGVTDLMEDCDDANAIDDDACRNDCTAPVCGDGIVDAFTSEACDDGNMVDDDGCRNDCTIPVCGDGIVDNVLEESCDDGNMIDDDGCRNDCTIPVCGDFIVDPQNAETCDPPGDPAGASGLDCRMDCTVCGDGVVDVTEDCDDGNSLDTDLCRNDCTQPGIVTRNADGANSVFADDIDGDGDYDVISASGNDNKIAWYENVDTTGDFLGDGEVWVEHLITDQATGAAWVTTGFLGYSGKSSQAKSGSKPHEEIERLEGQGRLAGKYPGANVFVASPGNNTIATYENIYGNGQTWNERVISGTVNGATSVGVGDFNGDFCNDVLATSGTDGSVIWFADTGCSGVAFSAANIIDAGLAGARAAVPARLNFDSAEDVLAVGFDANSVVAYLNGGDGTTWTRVVISNTAFGATSVEWGDFDSDSDTDAVVATAGDNTITWYENVDPGKGSGDGLTWAAHVVSTTSGGASAVYPADMDMDFDDDIVAAAGTDGTIVWYENAAGDGTVWIPHTVTTGFPGASAVIVHNVNQDFEPDIVGASFDLDTVAWFQNVGGNFRGNCGDGVVNAFESCDPPGTAAGGNGNLCRDVCTVCGDGIIDPGEGCDDGNGAEGDQCPNSCAQGAAVAPGRGRTAGQ